MQSKEIVAMLLAGGQGARLGGLTRSIAKPAVSFGGKYRIIDFSLSNCVNSGIDTVGVLTQYRPMLLNSYIGIGSAWDLDASVGGVHILPPYMEEDGGNWYKGTANAIYQNMDFIGGYDPEYVLILSGDHIYKMDYSAMLEYHKEKEADLTIAVIEVPWDEASRFGIITAERDGRISKFSEKPKEPDSNLASMGIYIFNWETLRVALLEDEADKDSHNDFGKNLIPMLHRQGKRIYSYCFKGYWRDVGTIRSYYEANMDLLGDEPELDIYDRRLRIYSNLNVLAPQYIGPKARISNSLISNDCRVLGEVVDSILAPGVFIGEGAVVKESIILPNASVMEGAYLQRTILGEDYEFSAGESIGKEKGLGDVSEKITLLVNEYAFLNKSR